MKETEGRILAVLEGSAVSLTHEEISEQTGITLPASAKCLESLEAKGLAERRTPGGIALYTVKGRKRGLI